MTDYDPGPVTVAPRVTSRTFADLDKVECEFRLGLPTPWGPPYLKWLPIQGAICRFRLVNAQNPGAVGYVAICPTCGQKYAAELNEGESTYEVVKVYQSTSDDAEWLDSFTSALAAGRILWVDTWGENSPVYVTGLE